MSDGTKQVTVTCHWRTTHTITVPEDWTVPSTLDGFPKEALDEMRSDDPSAHLVDWE